MAIALLQDAEDRSGVRMLLLNQSWKTYSSKRLLCSLGGVLSGGNGNSKVLAGHTGR